MATFLPHYALAAAPRYTSYPPATQFHSGVGASAFAAWLEALKPGDRLSLYVHIPFCHVLCWYCGCNTTVPNKVDRVERYVEVLQGEIAKVASRVDRGAEIVHVHFGGGTPNILPPATFAQILDGLRAGFAFSSAPEIAVECDPRGLDRAHAEAFAASGVTRVSLGVQDVSPDVQKLINRDQPFEAVRDAAEALRAAGVFGLNIDLMYGLPGQTIAHVTRSSKLAASLNPDRLAVFGYAHVPWFKKHQQAIDETRLPGPEERLEQSEAVADALVGEGYVRIGLDHFARAEDPLALAQREGRLKRNFQGYTTDPATALIGFGASSISSFPQGFVQNEPHIGRYVEAMGAGRLASARGVAVTDEDRMMAAAIERLMCDLEVDLSAVASAQGGDVGAFQDALSSLKTLVADGIVEVSGLRIRVTELGRPYVRNVATCFDAYYRNVEARHSKAV